MVASGGILAIFGIFLILTDIFVPMGVSGFGIPVLVIGVIMLIVGFKRPEPALVEPEPNKKFCWYCMKQISADSTECPNCSLPQHKASD